MEFVVNYTTSFSANELNQEIEDATRQLEKDDNKNDQITPYQQPQTFLATGAAIDRSTKFTPFINLGHNHVTG